MGKWLIRKKLGDMIGGKCRNNFLKFNFSLIKYLQSPLPQRIVNLTQNTSPSRRVRFFPNMKFPQFNSVPTTYHQKRFVLIFQEKPGISTIQITSGDAPQNILSTGINWHYKTIHHFYSKPKLLLIKPVELPK